MPIWAWILIGCGGGGCLLTVIMAAILFPVFAQAREKARAVSCLSNIKQSNLAILMYSQDYDETFPHTTQWQDLITPYVRREDVFHCPTASKGITTEDAPYGYAFNSDLLDKPLAKIASPRTTLMIYDSSNLSKNAADAGTSLPSPGRHMGLNNLGYVDGHAKGTRAMGGEMP